MKDKKGQGGTKMEGKEAGRNTRMNEGIKKGYLFLKVFHHSVKIIRYIRKSQ